MDRIFIPDLSAICHTSKQCIDRPATLCQVLKLRVKLDNPVDSSNVISNVLTKLNHHVEQDLPKSPANLQSVVKELCLLLHLNTDIPVQTKSTWIHRLLNKHKKRNFCTVDTFPVPVINELHSDIKSLNRLISEHTKIIASLQQSQKKCWITKSKANKYQHLLAVAQLSRAHLQNKLSKAEIKSRDKSIKSLEQTMLTKRAHADNASLSFQKLMCKEEHVRLEMDRLSRDIQQRIEFEVMDRLKQALFLLKDLTTSLLPLERREKMLAHLEEINIKDIVEKVIIEKQRTYMYTNPKVHVDTHGFHTAIPASQISS